MTPLANRLREVGINNAVYQVNRDTLVNESDPNIEHLPATSLSAKRPPPPPIVNPVPPPLPARNYTNENYTAMTNNSEKSRKQPEQPPELPPKIARAIVGTGKPPTSTHINTPVPKTNATNKENQTIAPTETEIVSPSHEIKPIQRHKSKNARKKMTEEEANKELGLLFISFN